MSVDLAAIRARLEKATQAWREGTFSHAASWRLLEDVRDLLALVEQPGAATAGDAREGVVLAERERAIAAAWDYMKRTADPHAEGVAAAIRAQGGDPQ